MFLRKKFKLKIKNNFWKTFIFFTSDLEVKIESISSIKTTDGWWNEANANKVLTNLSLSPIHLLIRLEAEILKKLDCDSEAIAFAIIVFPVPGGPNKSKPFIT